MHKILNYFNVILLVILILTSCIGIQPLNHSNENNKIESSDDPIDKYDEVRTIKGKPYSIFLYTDLLLRSLGEINIYYDITVQKTASENLFEYTKCDPVPYISYIENTLGLTKYGIKKVLNANYADFIIKADLYITFRALSAYTSIYSGEYTYKIFYSLINMQDYSVIAENEFIQEEIRSRKSDEYEVRTKTTRLEWNENVPPVSFSSELHNNHVDSSITFSKELAKTKRIALFMLTILKYFEDKGYSVVNFETEEHSLNFNPKLPMLFFSLAEFDDNGSIFIQLKFFYMTDKNEVINVWDGSALINKFYFEINPYYYLEKIAACFPSSTEIRLYYW